MSTYIDQSPTNLPGHAFSYLAKIDEALATHVISELARAGDIDSIVQAHRAGLAEVDGLDIAVERLCAVLHLAASAESHLVDERPLDSRLEAVTAWIASSFAKHGADLITRSFEKVDRLPIESRITRLRVLLQPEFGEAQHQFVPAHANRWRHGRDDRPVYITKVGEQVARGHIELSLEMCRPPISDFQQTLGLSPGEQGGRVTTLNHLEQIVLEDKQSDRGWKFIGGCLVPGSAAAMQAGSCLLAIVNAMGEGEEVSTPYRHMLHYYRLKPQAVLSRVVSLLALPCEFAQPDQAWTTLKAARLTYDTEEGARASIALCAWFRILDIPSKDDETFVRALRRFVLEGGLSADEQCDGRTLMQIAAEKGHTRLVETLLDLGADPRVCGSLCAESPVSLARAHGHETLAVALSAASARIAMHAAVASSQSNGRQLN